MSRTEIITESAFRILCQGVWKDYGALIQKRHEMETEEVVLLKAVRRRLMRQSGMSFPTEEEALLTAYAKHVTKSENKNETPNPSISVQGDFAKGYLDDIVDILSRYSKSSELEFDALQILDEELLKKAARKQSQRNKRLKS